MRIQAILRNSGAVTDDGEMQAKYDMLITWVKAVPKSMNKVSEHILGYVLCTSKFDIFLASSMICIM